MSGSNRRIWTGTLFAAIFVSGAALMVRGPVVPELGTTYGVPASQLGLIAPAGSIGYLAVITVVGFRAGKLSPQVIVGAGLVGAGLSLIGMAAAPLFGLFLVAVFVRGAMNGMVRGLARPILSHFHPDDRGRMYSYYDMAWAVGAAGGPLLVVGALAVANWRLAYVVLGVVTLAVGAVAWRLETPDVDGEEEPLALGDVRALLGRPEVLGMVAGLAVASGVEGGLFVWLPTYARTELSPALASVTLTVMIAGYVPGRFLYARLADRVGHVRLLLVVLGALVPVFVVMVTLAHGVWLLPAIAVVGLLVSSVYPLLLSYATDAVPEHSGPLTAMAAIASTVGVGVVPALMGVVISGNSAAAAMRLLLIPLGLAFLVVLAARLAERRRAAPTPVEA